MKERKTMSAKRGEVGKGDSEGKGRGWNGRWEEVDTA